MSSKDIQKELDKAFLKITRLQKENENLKRRLKELTPSTVSPSKTIHSNTIDNSATNEDKIKIFRDYFKGRDDVYAVRWTNRTGKSGYSPACYYEWDPTICQKPKGKCENCKYIPLDDGVVKKHLSGKHTIGIYPLLKDETCWFLAVDFDKSSWKKDAEIFTSSCRELDLPYALERSRSGNGCHIWFFFSEPIASAIARKFGTGILSLSIEKRRQIGFDSYDRLFPNQDTLPKGGFGNLIALPLQGHSRKEENTVFLDDSFKPYADQWVFLSGVKRLSLRQVSKVIKFIEKSRYTTIDIPMADSSEPWTLLRVKYMKDLTAMSCPKR